MGAGVVGAGVFVGACVGLGVFRGGSGVSVGTSVGGCVAATATVGGTVAGGRVAAPSVSESPHAAKARAKAHIRKMDMTQARLREVRLRYVNQLTHD